MVELLLNIIQISFNFYFWPKTKQQFIIHTLINFMSKINEILLCI